MATSGYSDKAQIFQETSFGAGSSGGTEKVFGYTQTIEFSADTHTEQAYTLESTDGLPTLNIDGVIEYSGSMEFLVYDGRAEFEAILGTLTDDGVSSWTASLNKTLPTYAIKTMVDDVDAAELQGVKFSKMTLDLARDEPVKCTLEFFYKKDDDITSFTPTAPDTAYMMFSDGYLKDGATVLGEVENIQIVIDRKVTPRRFIEQATTGEKRLISHLIEGTVSVTFSGQMTARKELLEKIRGGTSYTDSRSDTTLELNLNNGTKTIKVSLTGVRYTTTKRTLEKEQEVVLMDFSGVATGVSASGTY